MKSLTDGLAARLADGATRLCRCWLIVRADGTRRGFTDHDENVVFDGTRFDPAGGFSASADAAGSGFAAGGLDIAGALSAASLDEGDLSAGLYDGARVELWAGDWTSVEDRVRLRVGTLGEVTQADGAFRAEGARSRSGPRRDGGACHRATLRRRSRRPALRGRARVPSGDGGGDDRREGANRLRCVGLTHAAGWFTAGRLVFASGANAGQASEIRAHAAGGVLDLWRVPARAVAAGDVVRVTPGCDKTFATCGRSSATATISAASRSCRATISPCSPGAAPAAAACSERRLSGGRRR